MANLRFQKTFVFNPSSQLVTTNTVNSSTLTTGQVGIFGDNGLGTGTTPTPTTKKFIKIHQNVGDNRYGTVRTKPIHAQKVRRYYAKKATVPQAQITYIGYDEADTTKGLTAYCGTDFLVPMNVYSNKIRRYYGVVGYQQTIVVDTGCCAPCATNCETVDQVALAQKIADQINNVNPRAGDYPTNFELVNFMTATVVQAPVDPDGTPDSGDEYITAGVKLTGIVPAQPTYKAYDPFATYDIELPTFTVGQTYSGVYSTLNGRIPGTCNHLDVTTTQKATSGNGFAAEVRALEAESQGFDRLHEVGAMFDQRNQKPGYIFNSVDGTKYDFYYVQFDYTHDAGQTGAAQHTIMEPYEVIFAVPTTTGGNLETVLNSYLTPMGFSAINISSSTGAGDLNREDN